MCFGRTTWLKMMRLTLVFEDARHMSTFQRGPFQFRSIHVLYQNLLHFLNQAASTAWAWSEVLITMTLTLKWRIWAWGTNMSCRNKIDVNKKSFVANMYHITIHNSLWVSPASTFACLNMKFLVLTMQAEISIIVSEISTNDPHRGKKFPDSIAIATMILTTYIPEQSWL